MGFLVYLLFLLGLGSCFVLDSHRITTNDNEQQQQFEGSGEPEKPSFDEEMARFIATVQLYQFTAEDFQELELGEEAVGSMMILSKLQKVSSIVSLIEIRRVFRLKQQSIACRRLIDEEPIDPDMKLSPKAMRFFQLSVLVNSQICSEYQLQHSQNRFPVTDQLFSRAGFVMMKFPEIRKLIEMKHDEMGIKKFTFDKATIDKVFKATMEVKEATDLVLMKAFNQLTTMALDTMTGASTMDSKIYDDAVQERDQMMKEDF